ncbi:hypothetical protein [Lacibacter sp.]|uniref:hypothetical protein n=1 Tax=Lacibacter sp. TaxID=1915409 RepID=UPI002B4B76B1|nr:hypothetical protein [Lacibacter sp.]HLP36583.1 hypothetical protein [Lacibacter sp.]
MNNIENIRVELEDFIAVDKFKEYQHLQPAVENSTEETREFVNAEMNACCKELLQQLMQENIHEQDLKKTVRANLEKIEDYVLDTEDREFCYELYNKIGQILGIDIEDKTISMEQKLLQDLEKLAKNAGINLKDFLPPNSK